MRSVVAEAEGGGRAAVQAATTTEERRGRDGGAVRRDASTHQEVQLEEERQDASTGAHQALGAVMADDDDTLHGCRKQRSSTHWQRRGETRAAEHTAQAEERGETRLASTAAEYPGRGSATAASVRWR